MTKILAVKWPTSTDRVRSNTQHLQEVVDVQDVNTIKNLIGELLFNVNTLFRYNYCLIHHDNKMYVIEPNDYDKNTYCRKEISWHPLSHLLN
jgi:hypothetical protein